MLGNIISSIATPVFKIIEKLIPDPSQQAKAKLAFLEMQQNGELKELEEASKIIVAEAQGDSWLQRNWRPITMLTFAGLIVAKWIGWTAAGISPDVETQLLEIIKVGLGGYVVGRSAEKCIKEWKRYP